MSASRPLFSSQRPSRGHHTTSETGHLQTHAVRKRAATEQFDELANYFLGEKAWASQTYQLAGSLFRPRKTNVCRQSG